MEITYKKVELMKNNILQLLTEQREKDREEYKISRAKEITDLVTQDEFVMSQYKQFFDGHGEPSDNSTELAEEYVKMLAIAKPEELDEIDPNDLPF